jgi:hypothetical protein
MIKGAAPLEEARPTLLFNAETQDDEAKIRAMVDTTINALRNIPEEQGEALIGFDADCAIVVADLIDIGVAPEGASITTQMRNRAYTSGSVRMHMPRGYALDLAKYLEVGLIRHENGVMKPDDLTLH